MRTIALSRWLPLPLLLACFTDCGDPARLGEPLAQAAARPAHPGYATVVLGGAPHVRQEPDFCGEACVEMALGRLGRRYPQDEVFNVSGADPALGRGVVTAELRAALERIGFEPGAGAYDVGASAAEAGLEAQFRALHADLLAGVPSIVCMHYRAGPGATEHFRLVLGYDAARDEVVYNEPAEDAGAYRRMARALFLELWPLKYASTTWTVVRLRLEPGTLSDPPAHLSGFTRADYAQHVLALRARLGSRFTVVVEPPFVVAGDSPPDEVRGHAQYTVRWAAERLEKDFFDKRPAKILDVLLYRSAKSYNDGVKAFFGEVPDTPFGYYSSSRGALVMNISTGGGTLVHEIVHPYVEADFPGCPAWLNEGLGSLFEQSGEESGHVRGYPNWRLPSLQKAIRAGKVPSFAELTRGTDRSFYDDDPGTNYAQARYLCYYLQENQQLVPFYKAFRERQGQDPTGYLTLKNILKEDDMDAFKRRWEAFVLRLAFP